MEAGESDEECFARHGVEPDPDRLNVLVVKWASGPPDLPIDKSPKEPADDQVDQEIEQILVDLQHQGLSEEEIAQLVVDGARDNLPTNVGIDSTPSFDVGIQENQEIKSAEEPEQKLPVKRSDDVISLFRRKSY
jgi:hypothetical protein